MKLIDIIHYPLKSGAPVHQQSADVDHLGVQYDRRFMLVEQDGSFVSARRDPKLLNLSLTYYDSTIDLSYAGEHLASISSKSSGRMEVTVWDRTISSLCIDNASKPISDRLGRPVRLVYNDELSQDIAVKRYPWGPLFSDGYPILLTTTASLAAVNHASGGDYEMARFRPNLVIDNQIPWEEDHWHTFSIGSVLFKRVKPCERCVLTTRDPITGNKDPNQEPLKTLAKIHRGNDGAINFGQNIEVLTPGTINRGDAVTLIE